MTISGWAGQLGIRGDGGASAQASSSRVWQQTSRRERGEGAATWGHSEGYAVRTWRHNQRRRMTTSLRLRADHRHAGHFRHRTCQMSVGSTAEPAEIGLPTAPQRERTATDLFGYGSSGSSRDCSPTIQPVDPDEVRRSEQKLLCRFIRWRPVIREQTKARGHRHVKLCI